MITESDSARIFFQWKTDPAIFPTSSCPYYDALRPRPSAGRSALQPWRGKVTLNSPKPFGSLSTVMVPPCCCVTTVEPIAKEVQEHPSHVPLPGKDGRPQLREMS